jgi:hypothetical protein
MPYQWIYLLDGKWWMMNDDDNKKLEVSFCKPTITEESLNLKASSFKSG